MKNLRAISIAGFAVVCFGLAYQSLAQRPARVMVTSLSASLDKDGPHTDMAELKGPAPVTCISAISDDPKSPKPSCRITLPGFSGTVAVGNMVNAKDAGTVTLACNGTGWVRCRARVN